MMIYYHFDNNGSVKAPFKTKIMTAIEWLAEHLCNEPNFEFWEAVEQAKEMEKQQIMNAWLVDGYTDIKDDNWKTEFNEYYNETFKNTNK